MLEHHEICKLIPHAGEMCLLDAVTSWDKNAIICSTNTHRSKRNPLRNTKGLPMIALVEYAAQTIAVHGCLSATDNGAMKDGYLAALRDVQVAPGWLSDIETEIEISAKRVYAQAGNMIYTISVSSLSNNAASNRQCSILLVSGRITVMTKFSNR